MSLTADPSVSTSIMAGMTIGFYEYFAYRADWWKYEIRRRYILLEVI